ncbi:hypothetical protein [Arenicella chitinivorans]|uniref:hypothetical protein n=1 Tax=Arenicella chitinivorans TaxID=1329800 RepID=UPI001E2CCBDB|nr:hypothetical protein [Arenicella chitinivorans]
MNSELAWLKQSSNTVVISSEHFHSRLKSVEEVKALADLLSPYASKVSVVVYLRRQDKVAVSLFSTRCKETNSSLQILPEASSNVDSYYDYYALLERWSEVFGEEALVIRRFEGPRRGANALLLDFCDAAGLPSDVRYQYPEMFNRGLPGQAQYGLVWFNRIFSVQSGYHIWLKRQLSEYLVACFDGPQLLPARSDAESFLRRYNAGNRRVAERFLSNEQLFSTDFSGYPFSSEPRFNVDEVKQKVLEFCVSKQKNLCVPPLSRDGMLLLAYRVYYDSAPTIKRLIDSVFAR